ncbi:hypothetical protein PviCFBP13515_12965 [Pseudomonas viridiflava]|nr:hypothetical protein PviCFBP13507_03425 [Pseudomonas viridiflava]TKK27235.1 hypothetical protein PviCFBP13515_12965 [Pseudomonas viridiflava]
MDDWPFRGQVRSYQTTCNPLKKRVFVGADLSANAVVQPMNIRRMYWPFRGQVRSHLVCCATALRRDVVVTPTKTCSSSRLRVV